MLNATKYQSKSLWKHQFHWVYNIKCIFVLFYNTSRSSHDSVLYSEIVFNQWRSLRDIPCVPGTNFSEHYEECPLTLCIMSIDLANLIWVPCCALCPGIDHKKKNTMDFIEFVKRCWRILENMIIFCGPGTMMLANKMKPMIVESGLFMNISVSLRG